MGEFSDWAKKRADSTPSQPSKMKKLKAKETFTKGVRDLRNDLSDDYPGNIEFQGDVGPYKVLGKKHEGFNGTSEDVDALKKYTETSNEKQIPKHKIQWSLKNDGRCVVCGDTFKAGDSITVPCWGPGDR